MATTQQEQTEKTYQQEFITLWKNKNKEGKSYFSGHATFSNEETLSLTGFYNGKKKNPKEPDLRIYSKDQNDKLIEFASLWCNTSKAGEKYLTGYLKGNPRLEVKLIGFINKKSTSENHIPYLKIYKQDKLKKNNLKKSASQVEEELGF